MIKGNIVYLTSIEREDLEILRNWRNREDFRKYFREYREISKDMQEKWYQTKVLSDQSTIMFSIHDSLTNELVGCCGLCYINWVNKNSDLSLYIGKDFSYIDSEGIAEEACKLLFQYGFGELNLEKIWTEIYEFDSPKYELYKKINFQQDGILRRQYFHDGKWWDSYILSLLKDEFKGE